MRLSWNEFLDGYTYSVASSELLLGVDGAASSSGSVQGGVATNHGLSLAGTGARLATNLGDLIPVVRHIGGMCGVWVNVCVWITCVIVVGVVEVD